MSAKGNKIRWWPAWGILALAAALQIWVWGFGTGIRQERFMSSVGFLLLTVLALLLWFLLLSRLRWKHRFWGLGLIVVLGVVFFNLVRVQGVNGDLVPILAWRWNSGLEEAPVAADRKASLSLVTDHSFPQFLGRHRNATIPEVTLQTDWTSTSPREVWRRPVGEGWSGFAVVEDLAITLEQRGESEFVVAYDLGSGEIRWVHEDPARYSTVVGGTGPRSTPTVDGKVVFTTGATGILNALDLRSGALKWRRDVIQENGSSVPDWGYSASPLVLEGRVIVTAGGEGKLLVAYDRNSGDMIWSGGDGRIGYSSPTLMTLAGVPQILSFNGRSITSHHPGTGQVLWSHKWPGGQPNVMQPLQLPGDRVLASSGYGVGAKLFAVRPGSADDLSVELVWESPRLKSKFANIVYHQGYVYGLDDGILVCLDPETGQRVWKRGRYGHGQMLLVGPHLLLQTEKGEIVLIDPNPEELTELARFRIFQGKTWNSPTLAGRFLLVRTDREAACYEMPVEPAILSAHEFSGSDSKRKRDSL